MSVTGNLLLVSTMIGIPSIARAYRDTHLPMKQLDSSGSRFRVCGNDLVENVAIREEFAPFLKKTGIREDVLFGEQVITQTCPLQDMGYYGANSFRGGPAGVNLWRHLFLWDPNACRGALKHELGHIKHNDAARGPLMDGVAYTASLFSGSCFTLLAGTSLIARIALNMIAGAIIIVSMVFAKIISTRYRENQADEFALHESSIDELKGMRRFLVVAQRILQMARNKDGFFSKIWYYDWAHPSITTRIERINQELRTRMAPIDDAEELEREKRLTCFMYLTGTLQPTDTVREPPADFYLWAHPLQIGHLSKTC